MSFIQREIGMSTNLVILGQPPDRALFNVKSRTFESTYHGVFVDGDNNVAMATPLIFL